MKNNYVAFIVLLFLTINSFAQTKQAFQKADESSTISQESYPVDARPYLERFNKANGIDEKKIGEELKQSVLYKTTAVPFVVGSTKNWIASDLRDNTFYTTPATCRAVGTHCYIFVEDSLWLKRVDQPVVDGVMNAFDNSTPANANKGIYQTNVETFGDPPNVDGDAKIIIFILNIKDGYEGTGGYVAGYFHSVNESTTHFNSNKAEIYYLDANPANLITPAGLQKGMATTAHEFQHMIAFNYLPAYDTFFNESWSLVAEVVCGYPLYTQSYFNGETNHYLLDWRSGDSKLVLNDYSRAAKFGLYLYEQYGASILRSYLSNRIIGASGIDNYLKNLSPSTDFQTTFQNWLVANYLDDKSITPGLSKWGYNYSNIIKVTPKTILNPNVEYGSDAVYKLGAQYLSFTAGKNLNINFNTFNSSAIKIKAFKTGSAGKVVEDVTPGTNYSAPDFGTAFNNVTFMIYNDNRNEYSQGPFAYAYTSSGTFENKPIEIAYDTTPPASVYVLSVGDTVAVRFVGVSGTRLDSIRVALRNTAQMEGGVWKTGTSSSLIQRLAGPFYVAGNTTPGLPYPDPWPNWVKYDLRSLNIDAGNNFTVGFIIDGVYENSGSPTNRVMHTNIPSSSAYHSYTYLHSPGSGSSPGWYYLGDGTTISLYLIRAYVSDFTTGVEKVIELMPSSFKLSQNYPNPFNPSTVISYQLPVSGHVSLKVFDMLGREVAALVDEFQQAGSHNSQFSILNSQLSSGIYFYTLRAGNYLETKKMMLMK